MADIINRYLTRNPYFNDKKWIYADQLYGFMLHSVGVGQPDPMVFIRSWDNPNYTAAGLNGVIGADVTYITAPCLDSVSKVKRMPHGGKQYSNDHYIGFEMTEPAEIKYIGGDRFTISNLAAAQAHVRKTYANAVDLFAKLCMKHGKDPLKPGVIISHNEAGKHGIGTTHSDPEHLWTQLKLPFTMDGFRQDVYNKMNEEEIDMTKDELVKLIDERISIKLTGANTEPSNWAAKELEEAVAMGITDGARPQGYAKREEVAAMVRRAVIKG